MPWKAVVEINKVMSTGGLMYIATHPTWPPPTNAPGISGGYSEEGFQVTPESGDRVFEILECSSGPCRAAIIPFGKDEPMKGMYMHHRVSGNIRDRQENRPE